jgi:hypothetical protein
MNNNGGVEIELYMFLTSAPAEGEGSATRDPAPWFHRRLNGLRVSLDAIAKNRSLSLLGITPWSSRPEPLY